MPRPNLMLIKGGKMCDGYFRTYRKMSENKVLADGPGLYTKLWMWMLGKAFWKDTGNLKRGQFFTSIKEMQDHCSYLVGYRRVTPTVDQIRAAYEAFMKATMITTTRARHGLVITICNYDKYQAPQDDETLDETLDEDTPKPTRKEEDKRLKDLKPLDHLAMIDGTEETPKDPEPVDGKKKGKGPVKPPKVVVDDPLFVDFWTAYPRKQSKGAARKAWKKIKTPATVLPAILSALDWQKDSEDWKRDKGKFIPHPATYLNGERWLDERPADEFARWIF